MVVGGIFPRNLLSKMVHDFSWVSTWGRYWLDSSDPTCEQIWSPLMGYIGSQTLPTKSRCFAEHHLAGKNPFHLLLAQQASSKPS